MGVCDAQGGMPPHSSLPLSLCVGGFTRLGDCGRFGPPLIRLITLQTYVQRAETGVGREILSKRENPGTTPASGGRV